MKKLFLIFLLFISVKSYAQQNRASLTTRINNAIFTNTTKKITGDTLNHILKAIINSDCNVVDDGCGGGSGWSLTGNASTNPATNFIGTTDNHSFVIRTRDTARVAVDSTGNVSVTGGLNQTVTYGSINAQIVNNDGSGFVGLVSNDAANNLGSSYIKVVGGNIEMECTDIVGTGHIILQPGTAIEEGNVGIGTQSPTSKFFVVGNATFDSLTLADGTQGANKILTSNANGLASWANNAAPTISTGATAPASTPQKIGDLYVDTVAFKLYFSKGTASSADWIIVN